MRVLSAMFASLSVLPAEAELRGKKAMFVLVPPLVLACDEPKCFLTYNNTPKMVWIQQDFVFSREFAI
jgi:hypothetical protein